MMFVVCIISNAVNNNTIVIIQLDKRHMHDNNSNPNSTYIDLTTSTITPSTLTRVERIADEYIVTQRTRRRSREISDDDIRRDFIESQLPQRPFSNTPYDDTMNDIRREFETEFENDASLNDPRVSRDIRELMGLTQQPREITENRRQPPTDLINPAAMVQERRQRGQHPVAIVPDTFEPRQDRDGAVGRYTTMSVNNIINRYLDVHDPSEYNGTRETYETSPIIPQTHEAVPTINRSELKSVSDIINSCSETDETLLITPQTHEAVPTINRNALKYVTDILNLVSEIDASRSRNIHQQTSDTAAQTVANIRERATRTITDQTAATQMVLNNFNRSGTTNVSAANTNRRQQARTFTFTDRQEQQNTLAPVTIPPLPDDTFGFGDAMVQYMQRQQRSPQAETTIILESDSSSDTDLSSDESDRDDGWIDFTTAQGLQDALQLIRQESTDPSSINRFVGIGQPDASVRHNGNLADMYLDPETGDENRRINGVWRNITQEIIQQTAPPNQEARQANHSNEINTVPVSVQAPDNVYPLVFNPEDGMTYYLDNGQLRPLTIDTQADIEPVVNYLQRAVNNPNAVTHRGRSDFVDSRGFNVNVDHLLGGDTNDNREELSENINTNAVLSGTINTMTTRQHTIPQIPTIPTPNNTVNQTPTRTVVVPSIPTQPANPTVNQARQPVPWDPTGVMSRPIVTGPRVPVPIMPTGRQLPEPVNVNTGPVRMPPVLPTINDRRTQIPPPMLPTLNQPMRQMHMVMTPEGGVTTPKTQVNLPTENPYIRVPRAVMDAIAQERDITLVGSNMERAGQLFEFDHIMPEWIQSVLTKTIDNFQVLTGSKLYLFGAVNGVNFDGIGALPNRELINYIRVFILTSVPDHPGREFLPQLVTNLSRQVLEMFAGRIGIPRDNLRFISMDELRRAVITGRTDHIANGTIAIVAQRYNTLRNHKYANLLDDLYDVDGDDDAWINVARTAPHPMESVILGLDGYSSKEIVDTFGMAIPLSHANNIDQYIRANLVGYKNVLTRGTLDPIPLEVLVFMEPHGLENYISKLTDNEIFTNIGIYVAYTTRVELVRSVANTITRPQFMYPAIRVEARAHNKATTINFTPITDLDSFMVCYGTALKYYMYELDELTGAFYRDDDTGVMEFRRPENVRTKFVTQDVENLRRLLSCFPPTTDITDLMNRIDEGLIDAKEKIAYDDTARLQLRAFDNQTKELIQQYLRQIFYTGMYMRRWQGPGHAFPLKSDTTKHHREPDDKVSEQLGMGLALLKQMGQSPKNFCMSLKICEYNGRGNIDHGQTAFNNEWENVIKGTQCIRMASSKFVGTGYHYLRALFRETIPGMDVTAVDRII